MRRWTAWCGVALLALPGPLWGQEARVDRIREAFPAEAAERIEAVVGEAAAMGVPTEPLFDKALEGAAKRVPSDRVVAAVSEYAGRLQRATQLIGGAPDVGVVVAGADALRRGVSPDALRNVGGQAGARTPAALVVLGDLVESGVPVDRALEAVREALSDRHEPGALSDIPAALRRLIRDGHIPADAIQRISRWHAEGTGSTSDRSKASTRRLQPHRRTASTPRLRPAARSGQEISPPARRSELTNRSGFVARLESVVCFRGGEPISTDRVRFPRKRPATLVQRLPMDEALLRPLPR